MSTPPTRATKCATSSSRAWGRDLLQRQYLQSAEGADADCLHGLHAGLTSLVVVGTGRQNAQTLHRLRVARGTIGESPCSMVSGAP
jgi:hypothetical protein